MIIEDETLLRPNETEEMYGDNSKDNDILDWDYDYSFFKVLDLLIEEPIAKETILRDIIYV